MTGLPEQDLQRSKSKSRSRRGAITIIITLVSMVAIATHSRIALNAASEKLVVAKAKANGAATIFVGVPPIEQGNNGLALWSDDFCRPNLISLANALSEVSGTGQQQQTCGTEQC